MDDVELKELERGIQTMLTDKFWAVNAYAERYSQFKAYIVTVLGRALGEELDSIEYPKHWERFLKTKRCPKYMKELVVSRVNAYYPQISIPDEPHWVTIEKPYEKEE